VEYTYKKAENHELNLRSMVNEFAILVNTETYLSAFLGNSLSIIKHYLENISWVGFYFAKDNHLVLNHFQGEKAISVIEFNEGLCGQSYTNSEIILENDVCNNPNHLACSLESKSEIVIPLILNENVIGVLDIDSNVLNNFDQITGTYLGQVAAYIVYGFVKLG
jgi:GAF domain-containing protein